MGQHLTKQGRQQRDCAQQCTRLCNAAWQLGCQEPEILQPRGKDDTETKVHHEPVGVSPCTDISTTDRLGNWLIAVSEIPLTLLFPAGPTTLTRRLTAPPRYNRVWVVKVDRDRDRVKIRGSSECGQWYANREFMLSTFWPSCDASALLVAPMSSAIRLSRSFVIGGTLFRPVAVTNTAMVFESPGVVVRATDDKTIAQLREALQRVEVDLAAVYKDKEAELSLGGALYGEKLTIEAELTRLVNGPRLCRYCLTVSLPLGVWSAVGGSLRVGILPVGQPGKRTDIVTQLRSQAHH